MILFKCNCFGFKTALSKLLLLLDLGGCHESLMVRAVILLMHDMVSVAAFVFGVYLRLEGTAVKLFVLEKLFVLFYLAASQLALDDQKILGGSLISVRY